MNLDRRAARRSSSVPTCHGDLAVETADGELVCQGCGLAYPVRDDIPVLLVDEAREPA